MHREQARRKFPLFMDLGAWRILTVGGGRIARRRVQTLLEFEPGHLVVVARQLDPAFEKWKNLPNVSVCERAYREDDLENCQMVLAATDDGDLNEKIGRACKSRGILVNVASDQDMCDFHFPGIAVEGPVTVGINAGGLNHGLARKTREQIQSFLKGEAVCEEKKGRLL